VAVIYISFGQFCVTAWGTELTTPLITDKLGHEWPSWVVKALFSINLLFSFPLVIYPAVIIGDNYLFKGWVKSPKRMWGKNLFRLIMVGIVVLLTVALKQKLDKFLAILGSLTCTPVAFIFPSLFHF